MEEKRKYSSTVEFAFFQGKRVIECLETPPSVMRDYDEFWGKMPVWMAAYYSPALVLFELDRYHKEVATKPEYDMYESDTYPFPFIYGVTALELFYSSHARVAVQSNLLTRQQVIEFIKYLDFSRERSKEGLFPDYINKPFYDEGKQIFIEGYDLRYRRASGKYL